MDANHISNLIIEYRYIVLIPLTFIEGPVVAFIAGTLASFNYFNIYYLALLFFVRDVAVDGLYYALGYFGRNTKIAKRILRKIEVPQGGKHIEIKKLWETHPARTMFIGKLSYGIAAAFIVLAGMVKMSVKKFFEYGILVTFLQYGILLMFGYFFGSRFGGNFANLLENIQYVIAAFALILSVYYIVRWYIHSHLGKTKIEVNKKM